MMRATLSAAAKALETRAGRWIFWIAVAAAFLGIGADAVIRAELPQRTFVPRPKYASPTQISEHRDSQAEWRSSEFRGFRTIAWGEVMEGMDPYRDLQHVRAYPPFFGIAFFPFAMLWRIPFAGSALFFAVSFAFALAAARCCSAWADGGGTAVAPGRAHGRFGAFALVFILLAPLALDVMARCESDMLVLFPVAAAFCWLARGQRRFRAGALLGFAAAFKVLPGLFGVYLLLTRQWRALGGMIFAGVVCTAVLPVLLWGPERAWSLHLSWYEKVVAPYRSGRTTEFISDPYRPSNQSLTAAFNRLLRPLPMDASKGERNINLVSLSPGAVSTLVKTLQGLVALGLMLLWALCGRGRDAKSAAILMAAVAPGIMLLSEVSLTSHHVLLILPVAAILMRIMVLEDAVAARWSWALVVYLLALLGVAIQPLKPYTPLLPATAALLLACAAIALRDRQAAPASPRVS
ncbi:MAG: glycosyltransferase family 87 protein [Candidatus Brocadiia bacterium]